MEILYKTSSVSVGDGRNGSVKSDDGRIDYKLEMPTQMGGKGGATNPEQLFASGYAACFNGALNLAARLERERISDVSVKVEISLGKDDKGNLQLGANITASFKGVDQKRADELVAKAHTICPYSRAVTGNIEAIAKAVAL